ncbi:NUDIX domain-containing protein [Agromyces aurantiacus]|uniref:NUDIX domain-containing protein n=1 Tax=Agromyces aurantiacus TaxID=165814 RepID=A0ABV9R6T6_9MICO|nr:NUDIX hydrolase [Agromyces aurantiacus]MBM7503884.1 8-oxo-dGTP pyrophosphatase MutT (NUDIX family) [Agromyces aurantiacus]
MDRDAAPAPAPAVPDVGSAATVVLLRDGDGGVEVLLGERPRDRGSFAGAWVFPGGVVDDEDGAGDSIHSQAAARRAAVRETREEVGLEVDAGDLIEFAVWSPPEGVPKRLRTRFFAARAPRGEPAPAPDELIAVDWMRPGDALARHAAGVLTLYPPTWVTLHGLTGAGSVDEALDALRRGEVAAYVGRFSEDRTTLYWQEDDEFASAGAGAVASGAAREARRHRLRMAGLPWEYERSF